MRVTRTLNSPEVEAPKYIGIPDKVTKTIVAYVVEGRYPSGIVPMFIVLFVSVFKISRLKYLNSTNVTVPIFRKMILSNMSVGV